MNKFIGHSALVITMLGVVQTGFCATASEALREVDQLDVDVLVVEQVSQLPEIKKQVEALVQQEAGCATTSAAMREADKLDAEVLIAAQMSQLQQAQQLDQLQALVIENKLKWEKIGGKSQNKGIIARFCQVLNNNRGKLCYVTGATLATVSTLFWVGLGLQFILHNSPHLQAVISDIRLDMSKAAAEFVKCGVKKGC